MRATVSEWRHEEGWGVLTAHELEGEGIFVHFSAIETEGYISETKTPPVRAASP